MNDLQRRALAEGVPVSDVQAERIRELEAENERLKAALHEIFTVPAPDLSGDEAAFKMWKIAQRTLGE